MQAVYGLPVWLLVVRRLLAAIASARPVVLVIDDLQWAEPLLLDLVEHLVEWGSDVPLLVLVGARPELRDKRVSLATAGGLVADVVTLSGLDASASELSCCQLPASYIQSPRPESNEATSRSPHARRIVGSQPASFCQPPS